MRGPRRPLFSHLRVVCLVLACVCAARGQQAADAQVTRVLGTIKNTQAGILILTADSGGEITAHLVPSTKILRVPPGEKDLKNATPLQPQDLQPGDRVLVRGQSSAEGKSMAALAVIVMKQSDVSARQEHDREDWQKRGIGGLVTAVDAASGAITISAAGPGGNHDIAVHTSKTTVARRYAPDSVKFDDAKPASVDQIQTGNQLRARGTRNADGNELTAEDIVFGSFRNIAGTVTTIDAAANSMTVQDLIAKKPVVAKVTSDSQIKKLPAEMAQRIAMRLKGGQGSPNAAPPGIMSGGPQSTPAAASGSPDLQRFLGRLPTNSLADLQKGDAVMIVATQSSDPGTVTAITVIGGVEPILTASPNRGGMMLSPWSLGGGEGEAGP